ncbi:MAG: DNA translocase FtsK 4TM domain-containing protein [Persicimonas sp.]
MAAESTTQTAGNSPAIWREIGGVVLLGLALVMLLAIVSFQPSDVDASGDPSNLIGPVGVHVGDALLYLFGVGAFFFNALVAYVGFMMVVGRHIGWRWSEIAGQLMFVLAGAILSHLFLFEHTILGHMPGGMVGEFGGEILKGLFGTAGAAIIGVCALLMSLILATELSLGALIRRAAGQVHRFFAWVRHKWEVRRRYKERVREERKKILARAAETGEDPAKIAAELSIKPLIDGEYDFDVEKEVKEKLSKRLLDLVDGELDADDLEGSEPDDSTEESDPTADSGEWEMGEPAAVDDEFDGDEKLEAEADEPEIVIRHADQNAGGSSTSEADDEVIDMGSEKNPSGPVGGDFGPQIVESEGQKRAREKKELLADDDGDGVLFKPKKKGDYELPPISFLDYDDPDGAEVDTEALRKMATQIEQTLADFKVEGSIVEICPGPVITMFEFSPAPGVKISKIARLSDDLAMALAALSVRIVAPIPGKGVVGIEVPNPSREMVWLKEIIADDVFQDSQKELPLVLGKGTEGEPVVADLARMPHLLVAGATGSGKSVAVNAMICSLLYTHSPDDVQMIMVDPKMLEFNIYEDIPHLLLPVVTDPKQATVALNWAVNEMERRYQKLADLGVRNLKGYNKKVEKLTKQAEIDQMEGKEESRALRQLDIDEEGNPTHERMPYLVVVIDEFSDLMMTASKEVEQAVARLAQKARAAGIHVILATQRPSTDVITGLIKANFPTRVALRVTSKTDSRVILDSNGAENLLGNGDMLFVPPGTSNLKRVHGAFVSETEINQVVGFLKDQADPDYDESILEEDDDESESPLEQDWEKDEYYDDAVKIVVESNKASISMIQRKLRVGYNRAARMVDRMAQQGIVGESDGCKPREVLVDQVPEECR